MRVAVVTDSAANLPAEIVAANRIHVVPMILKFGERELRDGVDMPQGSFYKALVEERVPVSTSAPSAGDFRDAFEHVLGQADAVVCVTVASFVSASHDTAAAAAREIGSNVIVVDSRSASLGEGIPALEAARAAASGADAEGVARRAREVVDRTSFVATIDTFEFLRRSGRVNAVLAYAGTALNIKPLFAFRGGKIEQLGRVRSRARAIERLLEVTRETAAGGRVQIGIAHADCAAEAESVREALAGEVDASEIIVSEFTPLMGAHTGPGVLGVAITQA